MSGYLIDSDILIWYLRGRPEVTAIVNRLAVEGDLAVSAISQLEVQAGVRKGEEQATETFLAGFNCIAVDRAVADLAAQYVRGYRSRGVALGMADSIVAATAVLHDRTVVTKNTTHFPMPDVRLYPGSDV